jgi:hypothetical protein
MKLRSTAPESVLVHVHEPHPLACDYCGKPINPESFMDAAHDDCYEGCDSEPSSITELWAAEVNILDHDFGVDDVYDL